MYGIKLHKNQATIEGDDIIVPGKIMKTPEDQESPIGKEKFIFLPEGTQVKIRYNQDTSQGEIEILEYPFSFYENTPMTDHVKLDQTPKS